MKVIDVKLEQARKNIEAVIDRHNKWTQHPLPLYNDTTYNEYTMQQLLGKIVKYNKLRDKKQRADWTLRGWNNPTWEEVAKMRMKGTIDSKTYGMLIDSLKEAEEYKQPL